MAARESRTLLYLHGINDDDAGGRWLGALQSALARNNLPDLGEWGYDVVAPSYLDLLSNRGEPRPVDVPRMTYEPAADDMYERAATGYLASLSALEMRIKPLVEPDPGMVSRFPIAASAPAVVRVVSQAATYRNSSQLRAAVQSRVLANLGEATDLVVVAHSLGSVVACDLVYHLPPSVRIRALITLGSPLSLQELFGNLTRMKERFPFERMGPWLNVVGDCDLITGGRGLCTRFPEVLDAVIDTGTIPRAHSSKEYMDHDVVARALEWIGERENPGPKTSVPATRVAQELIPALVRAQYGLRLGQQMPRGEQRDRFGQARKEVAAKAAAALRAAGYDDPTLERNGYDAEARSVLNGRLGRWEGLAMLALMWSGNPVEPYELDLSREDRLVALGALAADIGVPQVWARSVVDANLSALKAVRAPTSAFAKVALGTVGVAAIAVAPALLAASIPAGLAGGAGLVAGLAALGPGGMVGGIAVVAALEGIGGAAVTGALLAGNSDDIKSNVAFLVTMALASSSLDCKSDDYVEWRQLRDMAHQLHLEHDRLARFSDPGSPALKELEKQCATLERAREFLRDAGLAPGSGQGAETD